MSKELRALRALRTIMPMQPSENDFSFWSEYSRSKEKYDRLLKQGEIIQKALTPPTEEEVCEQLSRHLKGINIEYRKDKKWFVSVQDEQENVMVWLMPNGHINFVTTLPPKLLSMIGRFYESQE